MPYIVLLEPGVILRPSNNVDTSNVAIVIPDPWKAFKPMLVTEDGIVMDVKPVMYWKAPYSILLTEDGIVMDVKPVLLLNACCPMLVTDDGIVIDFIVLLIKKAKLPITCTVDADSKKAVVRAVF